MNLSAQLRQQWANKTVNYSGLILITLLGIVIPTWYLGLKTWITPLILGVIAAALSETDDNFFGRIKAILLTLICFAIAAFSIEILFDTPVLFAIGLFCSSFAFILLGAIGPRYSSIAFGSLLIAIYTMIGATQSTDLWFQPVMLLAGALGYFFMSMIWSSIAPWQPVQLSLSAVFNQLSRYLAGKRTMFHPSIELRLQPLRVSEANLNVKTVAALNQCKMTLLNRSKKGHVDGPSDRYLQLYFIAQDIHERISSSHYRYQELSKKFARSDVLFRFKHVLEMQSESCAAIASAISLGQPYTHGQNSIRALAELQDSIEYLNQQSLPDCSEQLEQLNYLFNNMATVEKLLSNVSNPDIESIEEAVLDDTNPHTLSAMWSRIKTHLNKDSLLFRHATRLSLALTLGYGVIQALNLEHGYWILLTTLFVCQPNYSATRQKLYARIIGTVVGLLLGVPLLTLFPSFESQLFFIVISGVMFFALRLNNYGYATGFITVLVLFCFHQLGDGYAVVLPRLFDTLIGCLLAVGAVYFILPDWESKRLSKTMSNAIEANRQYLMQIIAQYRIGKQDTLAYRIARRRAHDTDAQLASTIANMLAEPGQYQKSTEQSFRFLTLNHALLSYISALGAHRQRLNDESIHCLVLQAHRTINRHLEVLNYQLSSHIQDHEFSTVDQFDIHRRLVEWRDDDDRSARMVLQQLHLIYRLLPELHNLANHLADQAPSDSDPNDKSSDKA
ncbi:YccS family putative transporter [Vibrio hippocampi]|uniref:Inner membrane protein YccS n=1 Tax=Vibrio hippocampi TaxID=654686 RepID=A0ABM8ZMB5_9VIBR|nr:YccS family putative transporter [Vibrio hippocampi]CAH0529637.1 Inner membrane protein YccS [Vibrio hippocampi]